MAQVTLTGPELEGLHIEDPAASVRLLFPLVPGAQDLAAPTWDGNEFLLPDRRRPNIRTFTPRRIDPDAHDLVIDVVIHDGGAASAWARAVKAGHPAAISGPGRGYSIDRSAEGFLLAGDETAIPAISQLLEVLPAGSPVDVHLEVRSDARLALPDRPQATVQWYETVPGGPPGEALVAAVEHVEIAVGTRVWVAGEALAVQRIRRHLFEDRGMARGEASVRGYWKHGRSGDAD